MTSPDGKGQTGSAQGVKKDQIKYKQTARKHLTTFKKNKTILTRVNKKTKRG